MDHPSVKYGLLGGVIGIIVSLVLWFVGPRFFLTYTTWFGLAVAIYFMYLAGKEARNINEGYIEFGEIFKYLFITFVVMSLVSTIFYYILFNFIDPSLVETQKEIAMEAVEKIANALGNEEMLEEMQDQLDDQSMDVTIATSIQSWVMGLIFGGILAAIMGAIMKKKDPSFNQFA